VVELEQDQVTALQQARTNIAADRRERLGIAQDRHINKENIKIAIRGFENKRQVAMIKKQDCEKPAKALRAAYIGLEMPESIVKDLEDRAERIRHLNDQIKEIDASLTDLGDQLTEADIQQRLAQKAVDDIDDQIGQIDRRIAEIRGF
jgi:hypothetical protein